MPAALAVDWDAMRLAFVAGASLEEIAKSYGVKFGTIAARSSRENWMTLRPKPNVKDVKSFADIWQRRAEESRQDWHGITKKVRKHLATADPDVIIQKADKLKAISDIERKNLGLDKDQPPVVLVNTVGNLDNSDTIDIEFVETSED